MIWETHHSHEVHEHQRDSSTVNAFCAVSKDKVYGGFFFEGSTITGPTYLEMLQNWLLTLLQPDSNDFISTTWSTVPLASHGSSLSE